MKSMVLQRLLGLPSEVTNLANDDTSGVKSKQLPSRVTQPSKRFNYLERKATNDFIRGPSHSAFVEQFETNIYQWVAFPDLFQYIRDVTFQTATDAFFRPHSLRQNPQLKENIWKFDESVPLLAKGLPKIFTSKAVKVREKCVEAFVRWRGSALEKLTASNTTSEWSEHSGLKCMHLRSEVSKTSRIGTQNLVLHLTLQYFLGKSLNCRCLSC